MVKFNCPDIEMFSKINVSSFPNPHNLATQIFNFIADHPGCTRDDLYDNFSRIDQMCWLREIEVIKFAPQGGFEITPEGKAVKKFVEWLAPVYELLDLVQSTGPHSFDELDINATMSGRHDLVEEGVAHKIEFIVQCCDACYHKHEIRGLQPWVIGVFASIAREMNEIAMLKETSLKRILKERYSLDFSIAALLKKLDEVSD